MFSRTVRKGSLQFGSLVVALGLVPAIASAQFHPKDTEWFSYAADVAGTRYRPPDQDNGSNFSGPEIGWGVKTGKFREPARAKTEGAPRVGKSGLYATPGERPAQSAHQ